MTVAQALDHLRRSGTREGVFYVSFLGLATLLLRFLEPRSGREATVVDLLASRIKFGLGRSGWAW